MITLNYMKWAHMLSYGPNNYLQLDNAPIVQLLGKNGYGKTSIAIILEELLFNKNSKGIKKSSLLNRYSNSKSYQGEVGFTVNDDLYVLSVKRSSTQIVKLEKNGVDVSAHTATSTYKLVEELLGIDHKAFCQIVNQSSASSLEFLTATDTQRKRFLIDLLNLTEYVQAGEHFKSLLKDTDGKISVVRGKLAVVSGWLEKNSKTDTTEVALEPEFVVDLTIRPNIARLDHELANLTVTNKQRTQNNKYKELLDSIELPSLASEPVDTTKDLIAEEASIITKKDLVTKSILKFSGLKGCCPTCDSPVDSNKVSDLLIQFERELNGFNSILDNIRLSKITLSNLLSKWRSDKEKHNQFENYYRLYNPDLAKELLDEQVLKSERLSLIAELNSQEAKLNKQLTFNAQANLHNAKVRLILEQCQEYESQSQELDYELSVLLALRTKLEVLVKTFSTSGLVAYKIECLVKDLEATTNHYLAELSGGRFQLSFQITGSDKLNVVITDNGLDVDIVELSNGERARVNMAALLGIRKLLESTSSSRINLLFLDEVIENLDTDGKEKLIEVLLNEPTLNTILVSHGFSHPLLERTNVIKENGISRIE